MAGKTGTGHRRHERIGQATATGLAVMGARVGITGRDGNDMMTETGRGRPCPSGGWGVASAAPPPAHICLLRPGWTA
jgi:hypothetical protein